MQIRKDAKIRVGCVGAGWMGATQMRRLRERDDVEIVALLEPNRERGLEVLAQLGLPAVILVDDYARMIADLAVDAVWLVSPNSSHGPQSIQAMEAGKHVFCEKPAATTYADFCRQIELEQAHPGLITFVDYILHFDPMETRLRGMVADGVFGELTQVQVNYRHAVNIAGDKVWKLRRATLGDAIAMGINHALSVIVELMASQARPVGVFATSQQARVRGFEADPIWNILIRFENGATAVCLGNIDNGCGYDAYHSLHGTKGGFVFDPQQNRPQKVRYWSEQTNARWVFPLDHDRCRQEDAVKLAWPVDTTTPDSGNVIEHQTGACVGHFLDCVRQGRASPLSFANARVIGEIGWAAQMSAGTGREVLLPLNPAEAGAFFDVRQQ